MTNRPNILRTLLATAVLATSAVATASGSASCDPMYPCYTDAGTPAAVYDLAAQSADRQAPTAEGLEAELVQVRPASHGAPSPAAVYDLAAQADQAPCQSYPCYPEHQAKSASPIAADAALTLRKVDERG